MKTTSRLLLCTICIAVATTALADQEVSLVVQRAEGIAAQDTPTDIYTVQVEPPAGGGAMQQLEVSKPGDSSITWRFLNTSTKQTWKVRVNDALGISICQANNIRFTPPAHAPGLEGVLATHPLGKPSVVDPLKRSLFIQISATKSDKKPATCVISVVKDTKKK